jgi:hypothetical protein
MRIIQAAPAARRSSVPRKSDFARRHQVPLVQPKAVGGGAAMKASRARSKSMGANIRPRVLRETLCAIKCALPERAAQGR